MKYSIQVDSGEIDKVLVKILDSTIDNIDNSVSIGVPFFSYNKKEEKKKLKKLRKALEITKLWYTEIGGEKLEDLLS